MTVRTPVTFAVKEGGDGKPWIAFEPLGKQLTGEGLPSGLFGLELPANTSGSQAEQIAKYLREHVENLTFTAMPLT